MNYKELNKLTYSKTASLMKTFLKVFFLMFISSGTLFAQPNEKSFIAADSKNIAYIGRFDFTDNKNPVFMYSGCAIRTVFSGTSVDVVLKDDDLKNWFTVILDDSLFIFKSDRKDNLYSIAKNLKDGRHSLEIIRRTEWHGGNTTFLGFYIDNGEKTEKPEVKDRKIEFIGDSYTCGYGNEGKSREEHFTYEIENNYLTFGAITSLALDAEYTTVCRSGIRMSRSNKEEPGFDMLNLYDSLAVGSSAVWDYSKSQPQVVVIVLDSNDDFSKVDSTYFAASYLEFLTKIRKNYPDTKIICIAGPSLDDAQWITNQSYISNIVNQFSKTDNSAFYFALSPIQMNGADWHPNVVEHKKMAAELIPEIRKLMNW